MPGCWLLRHGTQAHSWILSTEEQATLAYTSLKVILLVLFQITTHALKYSFFLIFNLFLKKNIKAGCGGLGRTAMSLRLVCTTVWGSPSKTSPLSWWWLCCYSGNKRPWTFLREKEVNTLLSPWSCPGRTQDLTIMLFSRLTSSSWALYDSSSCWTDSATSGKGLKRQCTALTVRQ